MFFKIQKIDQNNFDVITTNESIQGSNRAIGFLKKLNKRLEQQKTELDFDQGEAIKQALSAITTKCRARSPIIYRIQALLNPFSSAFQIEKLSQKILDVVDKKVQENDRSLFIYQTEVEYPEQLPRTEIAARTFGFKALSGFDLKERGDGYVTADNMSFDPSSSLRMTKVEVKSQLNKLKQAGKTDPISSKNIEILVEEYKIHLMPKPEMAETVMKRLQDRLSDDSKLKKAVAQYKILLGEEENGIIKLVEKKDKNGYVVPSIAIYAESKRDAQQILNALCDLFPDHEDLGTGIIPRHNQAIDSLIFYAQGSGDMKSLMSEDQLEGDKVHFKEEFPGQYHLKNPRI